MVLRHCQRLSLDLGLKYSKRFRGTLPLRRYCNCKHIKDKLALRPLVRAKIPQTEVIRVKLGVEVKGLQLKDVNKFPAFLKEEIRKLVYEERLVIFRDQDKLSGNTENEVSQWLDLLDSVEPNVNHPRTYCESTHEIAHRVSNCKLDESTDTGRPGWCIDGFFCPEPYKYALYRSTGTSKAGTKEFFGFSELLESIPVEMRRRWETLWSVPDTEEKFVRPLIYSHPVTGLQVMCMHLGMTNSFIIDKDTVTERKTGKEETEQLIEEIANEIEKDEKRLVYVHKWQKGDFIISDNLAVGTFSRTNSPKTEKPQQTARKETSIAKPTI